MWCVSFMGLKKTLQLNANAHNFKLPIAQWHTFNELHLNLNIPISIISIYQMCSRHFNYIATYSCDSQNNVNADKKEPMMKAPNTHISFLYKAILWFGSFAPRASLSLPFFGWLICQQIHLFISFTINLVPNILWPHFSFKHSPRTYRQLFCIFPISFVFCRFVAFAINFNRCFCLHSISIYWMFLFVCLFPTTNGFFFAVALTIPRFITVDNHFNILFYAYFRCND